MALGASGSLWGAPRDPLAEEGVGTCPVACRTFASLVCDVHHVASQQLLEGRVDRAGHPVGLLADLLEGRHGALRVDLFVDLELHTFVDAVRGYAAFGKGRTRRRLRPFSERHVHRTCRRAQIRQLTRPGEGKKAQLDLGVEGQAYNSVTLSSLDCLLAVLNPGLEAHGLPEGKP